MPLGVALETPAHAVPPVLAVAVRQPHIDAMITKAQWRKFIDHPVVEWSLFVLGVVLIIIGIVTGPIPGPGGIFFAAPGLALVLKTSIWAKRRYVKFKRWQPKVLGKQLEPGSWTDMALRRRSARRRKEVKKQQQSSALDQPGAN